MISYSPDAGTYEQMVVGDLIFRHDHRAGQRHHSDPPSICPAFVPQVAVCSRPLAAIGGAGWHRYDDQWALLILISSRCSQHSSRHRAGLQASNCAPFQHLFMIGASATCSANCGTRFEAIRSLDTCLLHTFSDSDCLAPVNAAANRASPIMQILAGTSDGNLIALNA